MKDDEARDLISMLAEISDKLDRLPHAEVGERGLETALNDLGARLNAAAPPVVDLGRIETSLGALHAKVDAGGAPSVARQVIEQVAEEVAQAPCSALAAISTPMRSPSRSPISTIGSTR